MKMKKLISVLFAVILLLAVVPCGMAESLEVPELDSVYPGQEVRLNGKSDEAQRVFAYYGPGEEFGSAHGYKPYKQLGITAYCNEGGWVLIHLKYRTAKERYLYMPDTAFTSLGGVTIAGEVQYYDGVTVCNAPVRLGPSDEFISEDNLTSIPENTAIRVFFQENGYMFAEFRAGSGNVRMWIPDYAVAISGTGSYTPAQRVRITPANEVGGEAAGAAETQETEQDEIICFCR